VLKSGAQTYPRELFCSNLGSISNALSDNTKQDSSINLEGPSSGATRPDCIPTCRLHISPVENRVEEAEATGKQAQAKVLDSRLAPVLYGIAFYRDDTSEMARQAASATGKANDGELLLAMQADTAAYFGHLRKAQEFSRQAADSAGRAGEKETAAGYYAVSALREALVGNADRAREQATLAKGRPSGRDMDYGLALALAYAGTRAGRKPWRMILARGFRRTRSYSSITCPHFAQSLRSSVQTLNRRLILFRLRLLMSLVCRR